jgi:hypothetical protein
MHGQCLTRHRSLPCRCFDSKCKHTQVLSYFTRSALSIIPQTDIGAITPNKPLCYLPQFSDTSVAVSFDKTPLLLQRQQHAWLNCHKTHLSFAYPSDVCPTSGIGNSSMDIKVFSNVCLQCNEIGIFNFLVHRLIAILKAS